jgi:hypothetical protein
MERGCDVHLDDKLMRSVLQYREKLQAYSQTVAQQLFAERAAHLQVEESAYLDLLVRCALSGRVSWLRLQQRRGAGTPEGVRSLLGGEFTPGSHVLVTNIRPGRAPVSPAALQMVHAGDHSCMKIASSGVSGVSEVTPVRRSDEAGSPINAIIAVRAEKVILLDDEGPHRHQSLRHLQAPGLDLPQVSSLTGAEIDFSFAVLDWHQAEVSASTNAASSEEIIVFGCDGERHGVVFSYPVPTELAAKVPWLVKGAQVRVTAAVVVHVDAFNDILRVARGDRTEVTLVPDPSGLPAERAGQPLRTAGPASATRKRPFHAPLVTPATNKRARTSPISTSSADASIARTPGGPTLSSMNFVTPGPPLNSAEKQNESAPKSARSQSSAEALLAELAWVKEDEHRRYAALRDSLGCFVPSNQLHDLERCDRLVVPAARLQAVEDTTRGIHNTLDATAESSVRMLMLTDVTTGLEKEVMADSRLLAFLTRQVAANAETTTASPHSPTNAEAAEVGPGGALAGRQVLRVVLSQCYHQVLVQVQGGCPRNSPSSGDGGSPHAEKRLQEDSRACSPSANGHTRTDIRAAVGGEDCDSACASRASASEVKLYWKLVWLSPAEGTHISTDFALKS